MTQDPAREHGSHSDEAEQDYEAPSVEEVDTEDAPGVTAAGEDSPLPPSDLRLKRSLCPLEGAITEPR